MALAVPRIPAEAAGARCQPPGQIPSLAAADAEPGDTMKDFAADDLEAADLLALARLDDDGAPPTATRRRLASTAPRRPYLDGSAPRPPSRPADDR
jgi:hypothetical protein